MLSSYNPSNQVFEARNLPDTDTFFLSKLINSKDVTDPYVSGYLDTTKVMIDDGEDDENDDDEERNINYDYADDDGCHCSILHQKNKVWQ